MTGTSEFIDVPAGRVAAIVTYLEMRARPELPDTPPPAGAALRRVGKPEPAWFRGLFRRIGSDWLWFSRLRLEDAALAAILHDPCIEVYALTVGGRDEGLLELDFRVEGACEMSFLGIAPAHVGTGAGRWLMGQACAIAWSRPIRRFWVHTCTLDHPNALGFYLRGGFTAYKREIEITHDPRLDGTLPRDAAPSIPVIAGEGSES